MFEKMLQDFLFGKDAQEREEREREIAREGLVKDHREEVARAMEASFETKLYRMIAGKLVQTLQTEGPLEFADLKAKCASVSRLEDALLYSHIQYAVDVGMIDTTECDGMTVYIAANPKV